MYMTISKLAGSAGVGVETVRFYQRRGLMEVPSNHGGIRRYGAEDVRRLRFIRQAQLAGFTLAEIGELMELDSGEDRTRAREVAEKRIRALDEKIEQLQLARESLARLAKECRSGQPGPCPIIDSIGR